MDLEDGIAGVNQLLSQIGVELNIDQGDCIVADEVVGGELLCPPGQNSLILTDELTHRPRSNSNQKVKDPRSKQTPVSLNLDSQSQLNQQTFAKEDIVGPDQPQRESSFDDNFQPNVQGDLKPARPRDVYRLPPGRKQDEGFKIEEL